MPRIKTQEFPYTDLQGNNLALQSVLEVGSGGDFFAVIPDWLEDNAAAVAKRFDASVSRPKTHLRIHAKRLDDVVNTLRLALQEYSEPDQQQELVIRYVVGTQCSIWEMPDSTLTPNGEVASKVYEKKFGVHSNRGDDGYGEWASFRHPLSSNERAAGGYSIIMGAAVYTKTTTTRGSSTKITFEKADSPDDSLECPIYRLNSFLVLDVDSKQYWQRHAQIEEMPYSPEAAEFFYNMMIGLSGLALKIERFFQDQSTLLQLIHKVNPEKACIVPFGNHNNPSIFIKMGLEND